MEKFDLEKAKQGRQIVHRDGYKAIDWHYFEGADYPISVMWDIRTFSPLSYNLYGKPYEGDDVVCIGLAPERVVEYINLYRDQLCSSIHRTLDRAIMASEGPEDDLMARYKFSVNPDGSDPTIERVE